MKTKPGAHVIYKDSQGTRVPGVTTIIGLLNKPALIPWANKMGLQGIDTTRYVDHLARAGTLAHHLILCHYKGEVPDMSDFTENQIELAGNSLMSYQAWESQHTIKPILIEVPLVSDTFKYGGTPDLYCELDGELTLLDFKTSKALYPEVMYQMAGYRNLIQDMVFNKIYRHCVDQCIALRIGRDESEGFEVKPGLNMDAAFGIFQSLLELYYRIREYEKGDK